MNQNYNILGNAHKVFTPKQNLIIWVNKKDAIFYNVKTNNLHVMCNGWIIALVMTRIL
jgi:hypothetical protein